MKATTQNKTITITNENTQTTTELQKTGVAAVGITSFLFGGWAVACMTAGVIANGGSVGLVTEYIKALVG